MEGDYGIKYLRMCSPDQLNLVKEAYEKYKPAEIQAIVDETVWFNICMNGQPFYNDSLSKLFHSFIQKLVSQFFHPKQMHILTYGYTYSPKNSTKNQHFHYDYELEVQTIFISMTNLTTQNSAQFIKLMPKSVTKQSKKLYVQDQLELLELCESDSVQIHQVICKPFSILHVKKGTIHRGIANRGSYDRPLFFINFTQQKFDIKQKQGAGLRSQYKDDPQSI